MRTLSSVFFREKFLLLRGYLNLSLKAFIEDIYFRREKLTLMKDFLQGSLNQSLRS